MAESNYSLLAGAALLVALGFAWLALAMDGHWEQVHGQTGPSAGQQKLLRLLGGSLLLASLALCLLADHATMAALVWLMLLAGGVLLNALLLAWRPAWLRLLWPR
ncbi:hypothetical protein HNP55_002558 [Paucibacter oligotrophus]|uniref:DUF3325 domain-containing protein n=1 Tax=Roseateles oligotrophus TaxID=1769250 RepID=A0A840LBJ3_9BURK|nr:DUF3325 domain-containing protein [Roseateles oligotrophus]MBB4844022.1 hypothetical protein [Roseateles oligotrophus]